MVTKCNLGNNFKTTLNYLFKEEKRAEIIFAHGVGFDKKRMIKGFEMQREMNSRVRSGMIHISLNHHPNDSDKLLGQEKAILLEWIERMKGKGFDFERTQFTIIKHNDREHQHYHLIANKVANDGKAFNDSFIGIKAKDISKQITKKYGLTPAEITKRIRENKTLKKEATREITPKAHRGFRM